MKAVILCGGKGLRMIGADGLSCKPLVEIGGMPILWHIMKIFKVYGISEFILCLGHNGSHIKEYFLNLNWKNNDFHLNKREVHFYNQPEEWNIIFADTGPETMTGGRIGRIKKYIDEDEFMLTYGDGVSDIPLDQLLTFHRQKGKIATVTGIKRRSGYGIIDVKNEVATSFMEKPLLDGWINGGFFILNKKVFDYISGDSCVWENEPLKKLVEDNQLAVYQHQGFWQSMDTVKDVELLNELWNSNNRPWVKW
jgi:glucose-1-phosphate cytidylyltransferase